MFLSKKNAGNLYTKCFVFFPLNNSPDVTCIYVIYREMIPVCYRLNVMFFKFLLIHKTLFFLCYTLPGKTWPEKSDDTKWPKLYAILFLFWNLVFMCKGSQPRIYADLLRF